MKHDDGIFGNREVHKKRQPNQVRQKMTQPYKSETNRLLGYPDDARLLIINADDFGMCHAINEAIISTLTSGVVCSTTLMVPCPAASNAIDWLRDNPDIAFGIHLTAIADAVHNRWRPLTARDKVPSLVDDEGYFYTFEQMRQFLAQANLPEMEMEFRAQIEAVMSAGLQPTHLDWHALRLQGRPDIIDLMIGLAKEYGLAMRVIGQPMLEKVHSQGLPANDYDFLDSSSLPSEGKGAIYAQLLRELPAGLSEWAVHPGIENAELRAIEPNSNGFRQADFDYLVSPEACAVIQQEGIILLSYKPLQEVWQGR